MALGVPMIKIFLCDLTHINGETLSSNVFPLGAGLLGAYLLASDLGKKVEVELFKYPHDLNERLMKGDIPNVIGFANYSWSLEISKSFARSIKASFPSIVTVFGGPNYGLSEDELRAFWGDVGFCVDFNVVLEGEVAFHTLISALIENDFDVGLVRANYQRLKNVHFLTKEGLIHKSELAERIDIESLPSPYLDTDLMDKFFDGKLIPLTHSTRGCPFKCTFCSEGAEYYNKVKQRSDRVYDEYRYIAERSVKVGMYDLMLSDANYGMFKEDAVRSESLAQVQKELGYPKNVYVSTGKNQKERVLGAVKKLNGAIQLSASLQSTDPQVLRNIDRSNISIEVLSASAHEALDNDVVSYTELILGLPGETQETHINSILDVIRAGFVNVRIYQLILLPQTELNTHHTRRRYEIQTRFRPMPRSFGHYNILGENVLVSESEEIVIQTNTLPYEDYVFCRKAGLMIDVMHNGFVFRECQRLLGAFGVPWDEFIDYALGKLRDNRLPPTLELRLTEFIELMEVKLFKSRQDLIDLMAEADAQEKMLSLTSNELAVFKAKILTNDFRELNDFVYESLAEFVSITGVSLSRELIGCVSKASLAMKDRFLSDFSEVSHEFRLSTTDWERFFVAVECSPTADFSMASDVTVALSFSHSASQVAETKRLLALYGETIDGFSRIVMRSPILEPKFRKLMGTRVISSEPLLKSLPAHQALVS